MFIQESHIATIDLYLEEADTVTEPVFIIMIS